MSLEITGRLFKLLSEMSGEGKNGQWKKLEFVIETTDQYPKTVSFSTWNEKTQIVKNFNIGDMITVSFEPQSREYNEKWFTELRAWRVQNAGQSNQQVANLPPAPPVEDTPPPPGEDDLPF